MSATPPPPPSLRRSSPPLSAGRVLDGKFELCAVLGEGATGIVYDARRIAEGDRVALKLIHPHLTGDAQIRGRFTREAAILRRLEGEHLCPILDFGELTDPRNGDGAATLLYMALPKIEGPSLERLLDAEGPLPIARVVELLRQVCLALDAAHKVGIIHRDLKPANVLLKDGKTVVVVDFGMAKIVAGPGGTGTTALTQHNMVFGTPEYMAPEQARGEELDARCDVYAAGIMAFQMLTGDVPFKGNPLQVLTAHMTVPAPSVRAKSPARGVSAALDALVAHALAKSPAERYPTAATLAAALAHARAAPDDVEGVKPQAVISIEGDGADGHSATIPAPIPSVTPTAADKVKVKGGSQPVLPSYRPPAPTGAGTTSRPPPSGERASASRPALARPTDAGLTNRGWTVVAVVAIALSIAAGVWLSLHS